MLFSEDVITGVPEILPDLLPTDYTVDHAPKRPINLSIEERNLAIRNSLRYFPQKWHNQLSKEFSKELDDYGHIYMYRFRPKYEMYSRPISEYPSKSIQAASIMLMIQNNLDPNVAQYPHELITYGGNGSVFQNWIQYRLTMYYLS